MARTAIVNPRRRKPRRKSNKRRAYGRAAAAAPKRRRNPSRTRRRSPKRRRNPAMPGNSAYSAAGYRQSNPNMFDIDRVMDVTPAATAGVWAARWALKMAGPFENATAGKAQRPGFKHAIAIVIASNVVQGIADSVLGAGKGAFAEIGALAFGGDVFARTTLFDDSKWVTDNLYLGDSDDSNDDEDLEGAFDGFEQESALGEPQYAVGPDGTLYEMSGADAMPDPAYQRTLSGFETQSALGAWGGLPSAANSFGYV
jgi:hypothetical protein